MQPHRGLDRFRLREIEQQLTSDIQKAREHVRMSLTDTEKLADSESLRIALQRFTDFALRNVIPREFL
jgi:hypothetical protein